ncbi:hypothetical protein ACJJTC_019228 [Scirpophaga incertulas]
MYYKCCVRGCLSNDELDVSYLHNLLVCEKHFEKRFIGARSRLLMDAYPTLFTADEISTGIPQVIITHLLTTTYNRKRHLDHTIAKKNLLQENFRTLSATAKRIYMEYTKSKSQGKISCSCKKSSEVFKG